MLGLISVNETNISRSQTRRSGYATATRIIKEFPVQRSDTSQRRALDKNGSFFSFFAYILFDTYYYIPLVTFPRKGF